MDKSSVAHGMVLDTTLVYQQSGRQMTLAVGTPSWFDWLQSATSFTFKCEEGGFTAHRSRASSGHGSWYWYAYRRMHGHLFKRYLGTSEHLTLSLLREAMLDLLTRGSEREYWQAVSSPAHEAIVDSDPVLLTKLHVPPLPGQHVMRPRLVALLERRACQSLTVVSASAGSGKTTVLVEWATMTSTSAKKFWRSRRLKCSVFCYEPAFWIASVDHSAMRSQAKQMGRRSLQKCYKRISFSVHWTRRKPGIATILCSPKRCARICGCNPPICFLNSIVRRAIVSDAPPDTFC